MKRALAAYHARFAILSLFFHVYMYIRILRKGITVPYARINPLWAVIVLVRNCIHKSEHTHTYTDIFIRFTIFLEMQEYIHNCAYSYLYIHSNARVFINAREYYELFLQNRLTTLLRHAKYVEYYYFLSLFSL